MSKLRRVRIRTFEETASLLQTFQLPFIEKKKDRAIRRVYSVANLMREKEGLPQKTYRMLNCNGMVEEVR